MKDEKLNSPQTEQCNIHDVSTRVFCPKCGSGHFEKWVEGSPHCVTHKAKCKDCDWIWILRQFF